MVFDIILTSFLTFCFSILIKKMFLTLISIPKFDPFFDTKVSKILLKRSILVVVVVGKCKLDTITLQRDVFWSF